mmetsp:Transcript_141538/g.246757  ORF Transcript_141538/g.246757 Transcript_141538/m.246757 type:complete len:383 (-) Transcript_141538:154-1302(-)
MRSQSSAMCRSSSWGASAARLASASSRALRSSSASFSWRRRFFASASFSSSCRRFSATVWAFSIMTDFWSLICCSRLRFSSFWLSRSILDRVRRSCSSCARRASSRSCAARSFACSCSICWMAVRFCGSGQFPGMAGAAASVTGAGMAHAWPDLRGTALDCTIRGPVAGAGWRSGRVEGRSRSRTKDKGWGAESRGPRSWRVSWEDPRKSCEARSSLRGGGGGKAGGGERPPASRSRRASPDPSLCPANSGWLKSISALASSMAQSVWGSRCTGLSPARWPSVEPGRRETGLVSGSGAAAGLLAAEGRGNSESRTVSTLLWAAGQAPAAPSLRPQTEEVGRLTSFSALVSFSAAGASVGTAAAGVGLAHPCLLVLTSGTEGS